MSDRDRAWDRLKAHRHYGYRACAPHWDNPAVCAADDTVATAVFFSVDQEPQRVRLNREATAKRLCSGCPIVDACREYAIGDGLREPHQVWGGTTPAERRHILADRHAAAWQQTTEPLPHDRIGKDEKQHVLWAAAVCADPARAAHEARLTETRLAWNLSCLFTLLRVPKPGRHLDDLWAARHDLVAAARAAGVMRLVPPVPGRLTAGPYQPRTVKATGRGSARTQHRDRFRHVPGQEELGLTPVGAVEAVVISFTAGRPARRMPQGAAA